MKKQIIIANLIDWSKSFVDENGSFYCGTTQEEKNNTAQLVGLADLVIETTDLHPVTAPEFNINGGLYPVHNLPFPETYKSEFVYSLGQDGKALKLEDKTVSPRLTDTLVQALQDRKKALIVPRGLYFQGSSKEPCFIAKNIEDTFETYLISDRDFVKGDHTHIIAPKKYFDATRLDSDISLPDTYNQRIPSINFNVYSLLKIKFPEDQYDLTFVNTGVVEGICRLHTSIGIKQYFPSDRVINIADATTPLAGIGLGYDTPEESREACKRVCRDIGIEYITTKEAFDLLGK